MSNFKHDHLIKVKHYKEVREKNDIHNTISREGV